MTKMQGEIKYDRMKRIWFFRGRKTERERMKVSPFELCDSIRRERERDKYGL